MRIIGISPFRSASQDEILGFIKECDQHLIVLPGWAENHPKKRQLQRSLHSGSMAFLEVNKSGWPYHPRIITSSSATKMKRQAFSHRPTNVELKRLEKRWQTRQLTLGKKKISFALCGEIDAYNVNGSVKASVSLPFKYLINPTHTIRGRWNHLGRKLEVLSKRGTVLHLANNDRNSPMLTTDIRLYKNGELQEVHRNEKFAWVEYEI